VFLLQILHVLTIVIVNCAQSQETNPKTNSVAFHFTVCALTVFLPKKDLVNIR